MAFIYVPPSDGKVLAFDYVQAPPRPGGFKVHFQKDRPFKGMTGINIFLEEPRWVLSEFLAYEVYRLANVPAPAAEHLRVWKNGQCAGYQLMIEQPNKSFLARNKRDENGNLYKVLWYGQGLIGQHEKKTNLGGGHGDLEELVESLQALRGRAQWQFIQQQFNVEECASYFAVNQCIQNWDGYHNNYFTYHDIGGSGRWEMYPWDEDKTWGDYDGASQDYDWYEMPLTFGMAGDPSHARGMWYRSGGYFAAPLLANAEFRKVFLGRVGELCRNVFTEEKILPMIDGLERRLEPEIAFLARAHGHDPRDAIKRFKAHCQSFRNQVKHRREYILKHLNSADSGAIK